ncbi:MAG: FKBP-type peptidyl-prolyl cis-trans isomerase [Bacteroidota bacterium]
MKSFSLAVILALVIIGCLESDQPVGVTKLETMRDSVSYAIGLNIGMNMLRDSVEMDPASLLQGLIDAKLDSTDRMLLPSESEKCLMEYQQELTTKRMENIRKQGEASLKKGMEWLAENKKKEGVIETASGLQYKVLSKGSGPKPTVQQTVRAHYKGTLIDGTKFDSSYDRNEPAEFPLSGVIAGWTEGLQLMEVGSKYELYIPPSLGYGENGSGPIGPNSVLIFEVELLSIK